MSRVHLFLSSVILIIVAALSACSSTPTAEENYALVVGEEYFVDTALTYRLTTDSLVFEFENPITNDCVVGEVCSYSQNRMT